MDVRLLLFAGLAAALAAPGAEGQPPSGNDPAPPPAAVAGVVVSALEPCVAAGPRPEPVTTPRVTDTFPEAGGTVRPGFLFLRVTFSERMSRCSFLMQNAEPLLLPVKAELSPDYRSFLFAMKTAPSTHYRIWFGPHSAGAAPSTFRSIYGRDAALYQLDFKTSAGPAVTTIDEALAQDRRFPQLLTASGPFVKLWVPRSIAGGAFPTCANCNGDLRTNRLGGLSVDLVAQPGATPYVATAGEK